MKYSIHDSLGETIGYIKEAGSEMQVLKIAWNKYPADKPTVRLINN